VEKLAEAIEARPQTLRHPPLAGNQGDMNVTQNEMKSLMECHGITAGEQSVYYYKHYKYGSLMDAVNYAELVASRAKKPKGDDRSELRRESGLDQS